MVAARTCIVLWALCCATPVLGKPAACPDGRFLLPAGTVLLAPSAGGALQGLALQSKTIAFDGSCGSARAQVKATRRATRILARWSRCGDRRRVLLKGTIAAPDCGRLRATVTARKTPAQSFEATRSACGDGYVDAAGGETCDAAGDEISFPLLDAAHTAIAGGATDVPLSPDGTLRFVRTTTATGGTDAIVRGATRLVEWIHDGDTTTMTADQDGDLTPELRIVSMRAPTRSATVEFDLDDDGVVERRTRMTYVDPDGVQVEILVPGQSPVGFSTSRLEAFGATDGGRAASVVGENCTTDEVTEAETALVDGLTSGLACMKRLGLDSVGKSIAGKVMKNGVTFRCGATSDCAQVDIVDTLTRGELPASLGINLGPKFFTGEGTCADSGMVIFHELLHMGFGDWHAPGLDRNDKASLHTDRVYACTDLCFRPTEASKRACATCLGVDRCAAACDAYANLPSDGDCGARVEITAFGCPAQACSCEGLPLPGVKFRETISGEASAAEGHYLRVNILESLGGTLTCGSWSRAACGTGGFGLACCQRQAGEPATTTFVATLPFPFQDACICPVPPPLDAGSLVAQIVTPANDAIVEDSRPIVCP
jgi:hypothetical protein